jgi:ribosomal protein S19
MSRSKWKGPFLLLEKKKKQKFRKIKIWQRNFIVSKKMIDKKVFIYTGNFFVPIRINQEKLGFKYGALCYTRKRYIAKKKKKKVNK